MNNAFSQARKALESVLAVRRGTSGRLILEVGDEQRVREALDQLPVERVPYAWEVTQDGKTALVSAQEFTRSTYERGSFKPLFEN